MIERLHRLLAERLAGVRLSPRQLLERDAPGGLAEPGLFSANRHCRLLRAADGWCALNLARPDDRDVVPALTGEVGEPWHVVTDWAATVPASEIRSRAVELQLPVAIVGESLPQDLAPLGGAAVPRKVVDLSALWAGPLCAGLLARAGSRVVRIESLGRPDPTPAGSPQLDAWLNGAKMRLPLDLRTAAGRAALLAELAEGDVLVTSARSAALARLGLTPDTLPHLTWVAITAHGFAGPGAMRVGFGDDCAVAGGLVRWQGDGPRFIGDALADPLTGLEGALRVLAGERGLIDLAMAQVAAGYAAAIA